MSQDDRNPLPSGWALSQLGELLSVIRGVTYRKEDSARQAGDGRWPILRANNIRDSLEFADLVYVPPAVVSAIQLLRKGDIVVAASSGSASLVGKAAQLKHDWEGSFGAFCFGLRPDPQMSARFLGWFLHTKEYRNRVSRAAAGVNINNLRAEHIELTPLGVPPETEQTRIADKLDELLSDLDAGVAALERVRAKLKHYRAAVLKAAVEGSLTADWRAHHPATESAADLLARILVERRHRWEEAQLRKFKYQGKEPPRNWKAKYHEPKALDTATLPQLPQDWCWATLDQLGTLDRGKSKHRPRDADFLYGGAYPFVQTGDVRKARQYLRQHSQTYSEAGLRQSRLWPAETLCITIAANIAETALLAYPACFPDSIVGVTFAEGMVLPRYVEFFMRYARQRIETYAPATAQKNINNQILRVLSVPLPSTDEQSVFVELVEDQLSVVDHLDADIDAKLGRAQALRQSILRAAFEGKLVPQDPNDEPASELLKRIAAEREERGKAANAARKATPQAKRRRQPVATV